MSLFRAPCATTISAASNDVRATPDSVGDMGDPGVTGKVEVPGHNL